MRESFSNRLKINAAIENAKAIVTLQKQYGSFEKWLESQHPKTKEEWVKLFKKTFRFTGGEIVNEFLMSAGYLPVAVQKTVPFIARSSKQNPFGIKRKRATQMSCCFTGIFLFRLQNFCRAGHSSSGRMKRSRYNRGNYNH